MNFHNSNFTFLLFIILLATHNGLCSQCGCKILRPCYKRMLDTLLDRDEVACIEDASIGASTITVFLNALKQFCGEFIDELGDESTYEGRHLYEVIVHNQEGSKNESTKPVMVIEAGQEGGSESVMFALYLIEQLVACREHNDMIRKIRWVILPCTNPDGMEFSRDEMKNWKKNLRPIGNYLSLGVDISRNFDTQWGSCPNEKNEFTQMFPGLAPASENETIFIKQVLSKYKKDTKIYLSIKCGGHSIGYPYAYTKTSPPNREQLIRIAGEVVTRVNQRSGGVYMFTNNSIFELEGKPHCGHSVDYAFDQGIHFAFEMRVFLGQTKNIIAKFQTLPRGYEANLRNGYFHVIKELYNVATNEKKYSWLR